jgi:hypothetical protein
MLSGGRMMIPTQIGQWWYLSSRDVARMAAAVAVSMKSSNERPDLGVSLYSLMVSS